MNIKINTSSNVLPLILFIGLSIVLISCDMKVMSHQMRYNRARNLHDHGKYAEAIVVYKEVLEKTSKNTEVIYDLGVAYAENNEIANAKKQVEALKQLDRRDLAEVLSSVIQSSDSDRSRKKQQSDYEDSKQQENH